MAARLVGGAYESDGFACPESCTDPGDQDGIGARVGSLHGAERQLETVKSSVLDCQWLGGPLRNGSIHLAVSVLEYRFDYRKAKPNRFAAALSEDTVAVVLEPDVAAVFKSSQAVNSLLRSVISAMPESQTTKRGPTRR